MTLNASLVSPYEIGASSELIVPFGSFETVNDFNKQVWAKSANSNTVSYAGSIVDYIDNPGRDPMFIQISNLSSGTLRINVDGRLARAF